VEINADLRRLQTELEPCAAEPDARGSDERKNMDKLKMHSPNLTQDNIARMRELFPGCVTEAKGEDGSVKLAVDFDQLRQELSGTLVEGPQERYHLNWPGKREALLTANAPIAKTLRPCVMRAWTLIPRRTCSSKATTLMR
jgi:hypothetical protein